MSDVQAQYEAYPYPERSPADEHKRLITGSPSFPTEMDHHLWQGQRNWSVPLRALFAGGGTGDGLIQLAQRLTDANRPYEITYLDLSGASRRIAEARATARGLRNITFKTGSLLDAAELGRFDYIDCCGVLHHLPDPSAGLTALRAALAPGGGLGFMVYAPYGRSGVYPLQNAFNRIFGHLPPKTRLKAARRAYRAVPDHHPFHLNPNLGDHKQSDAGFFDLLVHSTDRPFRIDEWLDALDATAWKLAGLAMPGLYDLSHFIAVPDDLSLKKQMATAEELRGTIKTHVGYAIAADAPAPAAPPLLSKIPHLVGTPSNPLAQAVASGKIPPLRVGLEQITINLRPDTAPLIALIDGKRTVAEIGAAAELAEDKSARVWTAIEAALTPWGVLHYSRVLI